MALLLTKDRNKLPEDAVRLSEQDALHYQFRIIENWEPSSDLWAVKYAPGILGSLSVFSGVFINQHYRTKLKLGRYGQLSSYLPIVAIPAIITSLFHRTLIQTDIVLNRRECPLCIQTRASLIQAGFGVVLPSLLGPLSSFFFATRYFTYRVPSVIEQPKELLKLWKKLTMPARPMIFGLFAVNFLFAGFLTYKEMKSFLEVQVKLMELERMVENS